MTHCTRKEKLLINLELNSDEYRENQVVIEKLFGKQFFIENGDTFKGTYSININYVGRVEDRLEDIITLLDRGIVADASMEELNYGYCLFSNLVNKIQKVIDHVKK